MQSYKDPYGLQFRKDVYKHGRKLIRHTIGISGAGWKVTRFPYVAEIIVRHIMGDIGMHIGRDGN